ncbi:glycine-rich domain-containing protein [Microscilla marina]|uniref:Uncharacterized protein n=1 Tax=Microscilla marina ATCC 23134 TaxID=313606 RepID=A1ZF29_MICM2|nr:hypothetical protein [Microscilla marina]EAY31131.1 conserved hypothetical protein [Microscilla marina ATCC 23134]
MVAEHQPIWEKIQAYKLDAVDASFPFSARLMRENGWTEAYTIEVIQEYKKFMFLVAVSGHSVSPSDPVDQVWHLHMIYTQSYWEEFCHGILGKAVHHNPTKGGKDERKKHVNMYDQTVESYLKYFGEPQPAHIWISTQDLFKEIHYRRVNMHRNWVIAKPQFVRKRWHLVPLLALVATLVMASDGGAVFVILLVVVVFIALIASIGGNNNGKGGNNSAGGGGWFVGCGSSDSGSDSGSSGCSSCSSCGGCGGCG